VRGEDRHCDRHRDPVRGERGRNRDPGSAQVARPVRLARPPEHNGGESNQNQADWREQEARPVLAARPGGARVRDCKRCSFERKNAENGGKRCAAARPQARVERRCQREQSERGQTPRQMVARLRTRLGRSERVNRRVQAENRDRAPDHQRVEPRASDRALEGGPTPRESAGHFQRGLMHRRCLLYVKMSRRRRRGSRFLRAHDPPPG
jgi:hypothetical protein